MQDCNYIYALSFDAGGDSGLALVSARNDMDAMQILKNGGRFNCTPDVYVLKSYKNIGLSSVFITQIILESYTNAQGVYDALVRYIDALKGDTPVFSIGSVETLSAGSQAYVYITGTPVRPVLNLGIPKGDSGLTTIDWGNISGDITKQTDLVTALNEIKTIANAKYTKPSTGIPKTDLASVVQTSLEKADSAYQKPSGGIPDTDLAEAVQTSLGLADSAYQKPSGGIPAEDIASDVIPTALADLSDDVTHRVVTDTEKTTWSGKQDAIADLSSIRAGAAAGATAYQKPGAGIPKTDLANAVKASLDLADSAIQGEPVGGITPPAEYYDYATKVYVDELGQKEDKDVSTLQMEVLGSYTDTFSFTKSGGSAPKRFVLPLRLTSGRKYKFTLSLATAVAYPTYVQLQDGNNAGITTLRSWDANTTSYSETLTAGQDYETIKLRVNNSSVDISDMKLVFEDLGSLQADVTKNAGDITTMTAGQKVLTQAQEDTDDNIEGIPAQAVSVEVEVTASTAIANTVRHSVNLKRGVYYALVLSGDCADSISVYFYKDGKAVGGYFNGSDTRVTSQGISQSNSRWYPYYITFEDDVTELGFYLQAAHALSTGSLFFHFDLLAIPGMVHAQNETAEREMAHPNSFLAKKAMLAEDRGYYFHPSYDDAVSYDDKSYLDEKIKTVPEGKHFIFTTDSHIDYANNIGARQKETEVMMYVRDRLGIRNVVFGGDFLGVMDTKYKAAKVMSLYCGEKFDAFGPDFLFCIGNHDLNLPATESANGSIPRATAMIEDTEAYKLTTGAMARYGIIQFDERLIAVINADTTFTSDEKAQLVAWVKQTYRYDDPTQKIRYIVIESGDGGAHQSVLGASTATANNILTDFVADSLITVPEGWDVVIVQHMVYFNSGYTELAGTWFKTLYDMLVCYKTKTDMVNRDLYTVVSAINRIITAQNHGCRYRRYRFKTHKGSGRIFTISGHWHTDVAFIVTKENSTYGVLPAEQEQTIGNNSLLYVISDRACAAGQYDGIAEALPDYATSYPNDTSAGTGEMETRIGTVKEVLFDIVTLTPDNKVVTTRIGAGSDRQYDLPNISA